MKLRYRFNLLHAQSFLFLTLLSIITYSCKKNDNIPKDLVKDFKQVNLVANSAEYAPVRIDPTLINPWGLVFNGTGAVAWPASQGSGLSQLYRNDAGITSPRAPVIIPTVGATSGGNPTGIVFNPTNFFKVPNTTARVNFIFAGVDGIISAWNGANNAIVTVDNSANSAYTGLALGRDGVDSFLYAADFRGAQIDVFDKDYKPVMDKPFADPYLPAGFAPFNIHNIDGLLYVLYAKVGPMGRSQAGKGLGYVNVFYTNGVLKQRLISKGELDAPWGIAKAPSSFLGEEMKGKQAVTGSVLIVGNFGNGHINVYTETGDFIGTMKSDHGPIVIEGLWALVFPPAGTATPTFDSNFLYFTAGPNEERDGIFGYLTK